MECLLAQSSPAESLLMSAPRLAWTAATFCAAFLALPSVTEAGVVLITNGEVVRKVADVPPEHAPFIQAQTGQPGVAVGQKYNQFGVFWLELWTWDGEPVLFKDDTFWEVPPALLADMLSVEESEIPQSWRYRYPPGLLVVGGVLLLVVLATVFGKSDEQAAREKFEELMQDDRYRRALDLLQERHDEAEASRETESDSVLDDLSPESTDSALQRAAAGAEDPDQVEDDGGFSEAVDNLVEQGIDREEAQQNLAFLVHVLIAASEAKEAAGAS